jgi:hypothetical protein
MVIVKPSAAATSMKYAGDCPPRAMYFATTPPTRCAVDWSNETHGSGSAEHPFPVVQRLVDRPRVGLVDERVAALIDAGELAGEAHHERRDLALTSATSKARPRGSSAFS